VQLVQLLLPLRDNTGHKFEAACYSRVRDELTERFGGVTAYQRSPAVGLWKEGAGEVSTDDVVIYEVMIDTLDRDWWSRYREELTQRFRQKDLIVRASSIERL
jgi:hypothetical protein